jgi:hypothetical protein
MLSRIISIVLMGVFLVVSSSAGFAADCSECLGEAAKLCQQVRGLATKRDILSRDKKSELSDIVLPVVEDLRQKGDRICAEALESLLDEIVNRGNVPAVSQPLRQEGRQVFIVVSDVKERTCLRCESQVVKQLTDSLKAELQKSNKIEILDDRGYLRSESSGRLASDIDFASLRQAGVRFLIAGVCDLTDNYVSNLELRIWDVSKSQTVQEAHYQNVGRSYNGMIRDFSLDVVSHISSGR